MVLMAIDLEKSGADVNRRSPVNGHLEPGVGTMEGCHLGAVRSPVREAVPGLRVSQACFHSVFRS